jgi:hypothetical protein
VPSGATSGMVVVTKNGASSPGVPFTVGTEGVEYYHTDGIGSVRMVTGLNGFVVSRHDYLPFGQEWIPAASADRVRFAGKEHDLETGTSGGVDGARLLRRSVPTDCHGTICHPGSRR